MARVPTTTSLPNVPVARAVWAPEDTTLRGFARELRGNSAYYRLARGL